MEKNRVMVGGGPAGMITALTAKSVYPEKVVCLIKHIGDGVVPCAIPYMMNTMPDPKQNIMGNAPLDKAGAEMMVDKIESLDTKASEIVL